MSHTYWNIAKFMVIDVIDRPCYNLQSRCYILQTIVHFKSENEKTRLFNVCGKFNSWFCGWCEPRLLMQGHRLSRHPGPLRPPENLAVNSCGQLRGQLRPMAGQISVQDMQCPFTGDVYVLSKSCRCLTANKTLHRVYYDTCQMLYPQLSPIFIGGDWMLIGQAKDRVPGCLGGDERLSPLQTLLLMTGDPYWSLRSRHLRFGVEISDTSTLLTFVSLVVHSKHLVLKHHLSRIQKFGPISQCLYRFHLIA